MEVFGGTHGIIMTFIIGLIVGIIAKFLMPGKDPGGFIVTAILGIVGSFIATWAGKALNLYQPGQTAGLRVIDQLHDDIQQRIALRRLPIGQCANDLIE